VNDAYNANPLSMRSSISWFVRQPYERHILVLGDMLELGEFGEEEHIRMGEYIAELHNAGMVDLLFTTGELGRFISESAGRVSSKDDWIVNVDKGCLKDDLLKVLKKGDSILFKASRVIALDEVFREILSDFNREER
ncbi:MAG TPA: UDP-N-acetylmuramoyl-tripeptide--D-alanyl-D-alanine ligase, partial [Firmicutes bacterium]|nr:UDP-N-acetylmuramoyl-tripeptide--D-alanyl-D-alanine ligase [Bacillota bacterium]